MKKKIFLLALLTLVPAAANAISISIYQGQITDLGSQEVVTDFGMVVGSIKFRLGEYSWGPAEIWLLPENTTPSQFKSLSQYLELPANITFSTCRTSIYYNESLGYAFKVLSSAILSNGTFCALAYPGSYVVVAKY